MMKLFPCLDCGHPGFTAVCEPCTEERQGREPDTWFRRLRDELWDAYPQGDWLGYGPGERQPPEPQRRAKRAKGVTA